MNYKEAKKAFDEAIETLTLVDHYRDIIEYKHQDGTVCRFTHASYTEIDEDWFAIFSEHNGRVLNHKADVEWIKEIKENTIYFNTEL